MAGSERERRILRLLAQGWTLKVHRSLEGEKLYRLHSLAGKSESVPGEAVRSLERQALIQSNQKFPAATFLLTDQGRTEAAALAGSEVKALGANKFRGL